MSSKKRLIMIEKQLDTAMQNYPCWQRWASIKDESMKLILAPYDLTASNEELQRFTRLMQYLHKLAHKIGSCHCEYSSINTDIAY
jgi:hypothetical protein